MLSIDLTTIATIETEASTAVTTVAQVLFQLGSTFAEEFSKASAQWSENVIMTMITAVALLPLL